MRLIIKRLLIFLMRLKNTVYMVLKGNYILVKWYNPSSNRQNFGDLLNEYLIGELSMKKVYHCNKIYNIFKKPVYSVIGSVLNNSNVNNLNIWGSGFISENGKILARDIKVYAVRGSLTRQKLLEQDIICPEIYGDPALLLPILQQERKTNKYKIGFIAHYADKNTYTFKMLHKKYQDNPSVIFIDIESERDIITKQVNQCSLIMSSSLHGLIIADAYGISSLWIRISDQVYGGNFKFQDYFSSIGKKNMLPVDINENIDLFSIKHENESFDISSIQLNLLASCPFIEQSKKKEMVKIINEK